MFAKNSSLRRNVIVLSLFIIGALIFAPSKSVSAEYDGGNLIDNSTFLNANSMSLTAIQNHLISKGSGLATRSFALNCYAQDSKERQWYTAVGAPCDQTVPASHIIYYTAQVYGLNPQVILATLQKEQSLITSPNPTDWQINQAMGYGCPTTGGCGASNFFYQIDNGTWALRYHYERANGNFNWWTPSSSWVCGTEKNFYKPNLYPGQNVNFYDEDGVYYRTHFIVNAATSSLYCYTPHAYNNPQGLYGRAPYGTSGRYYSGSYNFVYFFELWFGPTKGTVLIQGSSPTVYLIDASTNTRYGVPSFEMLVNYGLSQTRVTPVSDAYINGLADGGVLGTLFSLPGDPTVYLADGGNKYGIPSAQICVDWVLNCTTGVRQINSSIASFMRNGPTVYGLMNHSYTIYKVTNGIRRPYLSPAALTQDGQNGNYAIPIYSSYNLRQTDGPPYVEQGVLVKFGNDPSIFYHINNKFYKLYSYSTYLSWFPGRGAYQDTRSSYVSSGPPVQGVITQFFKTSNNTVYFVNNGAKINITQNSASWPTPVTSADLEPYVTTLPSGGADEPKNTYRTPNGAIYIIKNGEKSVILSMNDFWALGYSLSDTINVSEEALAGISNGIPYFGEGSLFKVSGSDTLYLKGAKLSVYRLTSLTQLSQYKLYSEAYVLPNSVLNRYDAPKTLSSFVTTDNGLSYQFIDLQGKIWSFGTAQQNQWGINSSVIANGGSGFTDSNHPIRSLSKTQQVLPAFAYHEGTIYYGTGGQKRRITSYDKYLSMGGNASNTFNASNEFITASPSGDPI